MKNGWIATVVGGAAVGMLAVGVVAMINNTSSSPSDSSATASAVAEDSSSSISCSRLWRCTASRADPAGIASQRLRSSGGSNSALRQGLPTSTSRATRSGHASAQRPATSAPKEKPTSCTGVSPTSDCKPSSSQAGSTSASWPSGGTAESPKPGKSGTHTA